MEVYVLYTESGSYSDYGMTVEGVFESLEQAQGALSSEPIKGYLGLMEWEKWYGPDDDDDDDDGRTWHQQMKYSNHKYDSQKRTIFRCDVGAVWSTY